MRPYYEDEAVTIYHGDARQIAEVRSDDVIISDPPFGIGYASGWSKETRDHANAIAGDATTELRDWMLNNFAKDGPLAAFATIRCVPPFPPRGTLIWDKGECAGMGDLAFPWKPNYEVIWIWGDGWAGNRTTSVLRGSFVPNTSSGGRSHPHEKPVWLLAELIKKAPPGRIVDPFMGSGTTLRAAKDLGRRAIGIEIEEKYCEIAAKRMAQEVLPL